MAIKFEDEANVDWDVSLLSYDEFLQFFFGTEEAPWQRSPYPIPRFEYPERIVEHLSRLFMEFQKVADRFGEFRINRGIWAMWGWNFELATTLWMPEVDLKKRIECIKATYFVYADHVSKSRVQVMENCFDMWWELISDSFWFDKGGQRKYENLSLESQEILDAMFATLEKILLLEDPRAQSYALHGLGHIAHPGVKSVVQGYLNEHRNEMTPEGVEWIEKCRDGTVM